MSQNNNIYYAWLDKKIEEYKNFIEKCKRDIAHNQKILQEIKKQNRKEEQNVTENC